ncbi:MAG: PPOX class F420-dependent oxidoreductase [Sinobacterium sp.]|nr:PPOX class F420-dependent oxidoreductase [Sinobacterium sp.]
MTMPIMKNNWNTSDYLLLATQKRDGSWIETPVWFGKSEFNGKPCFYLFSEGSAGKVKRIRNFSQVKVQSCTLLGKPLGEFETANATLLDKHEEHDAHRALIRQYGSKMRLLDIGSWLARKKHKRAFIRIEFA